eukprot:scaffold11092_cov66-Skeletonema_dohrnii-CCMP3373.AAC.1
MECLFPTECEHGTIETQGADLLPVQHQKEEEVKFQERNRSKRRGSKLNKSSSSKKENKVIEILDDDDGQIEQNSATVTAKKSLLSHNSSDTSGMGDRDICYYYSLVCNVSPIVFLQYEYTPKYKPTLGIDPKAATPSPAYRLSIPPGRLTTCRVASSNPRDLPPETCCCTVLSVSNGASIVLEQAAARPEASVFLRPSAMADED